MKIKGFKLLNLDLVGNSFLGTISYKFVNDSDRFDSIYTTVLIGPNGTGKSNVFRIVINLLRELYDLSTSQFRGYSVDV